MELGPWGGVQLRKLLKEIANKRWFGRKIRFLEESVEIRRNFEEKVWRREWESAKSFCVRLPIFAAGRQLLPILPGRWHSK